MEHWLRKNAEAVVEEFESLKAKLEAGLRFPVGEREMLVNNPREWVRRVLATKKHPTWARLKKEVLPEGLWERVCTSDGVFAHVMCCWLFVALDAKLAEIEAAFKSVENPPPDWVLAMNGKKQKALERQRRLKDTIPPLSDAPEPEGDAGCPGSYGANVLGDEYDPKDDRGIHTRTRRSTKGH